MIHRLHTCGAVAAAGPIICVLLICLFVTPIALRSTSAANAAAFQLSGRVTNQSGTGLLNARVDVIDPATNNIVATANTDASGNYFLMVNGGTYNVRVTPPTGSGLQSAIALNRVINGNAVLDFILVPAASVVTLSGKVIGPLGNGLANQRVLYRLASLPDNSSYNQAIYTDVAGNYSFQVAPGDYALYVDGSPPASANAPSNYYMRADASLTLAQNTVMDIPVLAKRISVHVQDPAGNAVPGVGLTTSLPGFYNLATMLGTLPAHGGSSYGATTDGSGNATMWLLPTNGANYTFIATPPSGSPFAPFNVQNVSFTTDKTIVIALSYACQSLTVNPASLFPGRVGVAYNQSLTQTGGTGNVTFTLSGTVPTGLTFSGNTLSGTTTQAGNFPITVIALDQNQCAGIRDYTLQICPTITLSPATLPNGTVGTNYNQTITASGGTVSYSFSLLSGSLPTNVMLSAGGLLSGTPNATGNFNFTIKATDANGCTGTQDYAVTINSAIPTLGNYPNATVIIGGNTTVTPTAAPANTTSITAATSTNFKGILTVDLTTGVVTVTNANVAGVYTVTVTASNGSGGTATKTFTLTVTNPANCSLPGFGFNQPTGSPFGMGGNPSVAVGDFNGDGKQDLATANGTILLGNGSGGFNPAPSLPPAGTDSRPNSVAVGDFNGDGRQDLAIANSGPQYNSVTIQLGNGSGGFSPAAGSPISSLGTTPYSVSVADFNHDGKQDLAVANANSANVAILLGNGSGGFSHAPGSPISVGNGP